MSGTLLAVKGVSKSFPGVKALDDVSFDVRPGTVHALCGENGAGKSTLMKVIDGIYAADSGVRVDPRRRGADQEPHRGPRPRHRDDRPGAELRAAHDHRRELLPRPVADESAATSTGGYIRKEAARVLREEGLDYPVNRRLGTLTVSEIQTLEIARAVYHSADVLIMDEPTSAIAHREVEALFEKIRALRRQGKAIIYISHKMDEVFELADDISGAPRRGGGQLAALRRGDDQPGDRPDGRSRARPPPVPQGAGSRSGRRSSR